MSRDSIYTTKNVLFQCRGPLALPRKHRVEVGLTRFPKKERGYTAYLLRRVSLTIHDINATQFTMQRCMKDTRLFDNNSKIYLHTVQIKQNENEKNNDRHNKGTGKLSTERMSTEK